MQSESSFGQMLTLHAHLYLIVINISKGDKMPFMLSPAKFSSSIPIPEGHLRAIELDKNSREQMNACYALRHEYFVRKRQWVSASASLADLEYDCYDAAAHHLGVFDGDALLGYLRALPWTENFGFMLEHEFSCLLTDDDVGSLRKADALEVSRLVLNPDVQWEHCQTIVELLLKSLYHLAKRQQKPIVYMVVEESWLRPFVRRFKLPLQRIGTPYTFPDGTRTIAAMTDIRDLEKLFAARYPDKFQWYQQI
jgi:N-acyl-L-homoserine lactone synthetase